MQRPMGEWYLAKKMHESGFTCLASQTLDWRKGARTSGKGYRLPSSILFIFDYDVIAGAQTETQGQR
jgi:hypothetical protein